MYDIKNIKGIGPKTAETLSKLGIETIEDLLKHYPYRYEEYQAPAKISTLIKDISKESKKVCICAKCIKPILNKQAKMMISSSVISDGSELLEVNWYNMPYIKNAIKIYNEYVFVGSISSKRGRFILEQPIIYNVDEYKKLIGTLKPIYSLTKGISNKFFIKTLDILLKSDNMSEFKEYFPAEILNKYSLIDLESAYKNIHFPKQMDVLENSRKRLVFDEFFLFLTALKKRKEDYIDIKSEYSIKIPFELTGFKETLPFKLTDSQVQVIDNILKDMSSGFVMNKLIQGDVGSGKTVVSLFAMLSCYFNSYQSAIMVPTEVLAKQHFENIKKLVSTLDNPPKIGLLVGSMTKKEHDIIHEKIKNHEVDIIIGTHALIQKKVEYANLALVITDEQHRFGVMQRQKFANKGKMPHILVMSATPIPRTLAVILYGDLSVETIKSKPHGRLPIKNAVIEEKDRKKAYKHILSELKKGHQAYVICPLVEESENLKVTDVVSYADILRENFKNEYKIEYLHGKMKQQEKDEIMQRFVDNEISILVSTTVIEVGVDVKNATVIMIEDAQRFGLASLHQLRGRVGRNELQSYCIFVKTSDNDNAKKRLDVVGNSNDGFYIANEDLKLRGPGELFGMAQSGELDFGIADIYSDKEILEDVNELVKNIDKYEFTTEEKKLLDFNMEKYLRKIFNKLSL